MSSPVPVLEDATLCIEPDGDQFLLAREATGLTIAGYPQIGYHRDCKLQPVNPG